MASLPPNIEKVNPLSNMGLLPPIQRSLEIFAEQTIDVNIQKLEFVGLGGTENIRLF